MVGQAGRHGWGALDPVYAPFGSPEGLWIGCLPACQNNEPEKRQISSPGS